MISIIVPIYNVGQYLTKCLDSIKSQTYDDYEVILVDDGSTDDSYEICQKYVEADKRFKLYTKENGGVSSARNFGLNKAKGEWIGFIDSDDYVKKDFYQYLISLTNVIECEMVCCGVVREHRDGSVSRILEYKDTVDYKVLDRENALNNYFLYNDRYFCWAPWNKLIKADIAKKITFEEGKSMAEDFYYTLECIIACKTILYSNQGLYYYVDRLNSAVNTIAISSKTFDSLYFAKKANNLLFESGFNDNIINKTKSHKERVLIDTYYRIVKYGKTDDITKFKENINMVISDFNRINVAKVVRLPIKFILKYMVCRFHRIVRKEI